MHLTFREKVKEVEKFSENEACLKNEKLDAEKALDLIKADLKEVRE